MQYQPQIPRKIRLLMMICALVFLPSCLTGKTKVVYVDKDSKPMRIAKKCKTQVWVKDASGADVKSDNDVEIPEGWYALPPPSQPKEPAK